MFRATFLFSQVSTVKEKQVTLRVRMIWAWNQKQVSMKSVSNSFHDNTDRIFYAGIWKRRFHSDKLLSVRHITPEELKNAIITGHFGFIIWGNSVRKTVWLPWRHSFRKFCLQNCFPPTKNEEPKFLNTSGLKSILEKLRFRDRLVWTVSLTVKKQSCVFKVLRRSGSTLPELTQVHCMLISFVKATFATFIIFFLDADIIDKPIKYLKISAYHASGKH